MNISTYESRIKALEDQLNPPVPGPVAETGLISMTFTPDILLTDGTTINKKLGELLPMESGLQTVSFITTTDQIPVTNTFTVNIVPGSEWYAKNGEDEEENPTFGEKGERTYLSVTPHNEGDHDLVLPVSAIAVSTTTPSDPSYVHAAISVHISAPL